MVEASPMLEKMSKRIEIAANISIIIAALLGSLILIRNHLFEKRPIADRAETEKTSVRREPLVGSPVSLPNVDWAKNGQTLLIVLSKDCHFCAESAPFYKRIVLEATKRQVFQ